MTSRHPCPELPLTQGKENPYLCFGYIPKDF